MSHVFKFLFLSFFSFGVFANENLDQADHSESQYFIDTYYGESHISNKTYVGLDLGINKSFNDEKNTGFFVLRFTDLEDTSVTNKDGSDDVMLGAGFSYNSTISPFIEAGFDVADPIDDLVQRFADGFEIMFNEIFNNNFGDCRDDDTCRKVRIDKYFRTGVRAQLSSYMTLGVFFERVSVGSNISNDTVYHKVVAASIGIRF